MIFTHLACNLLHGLQELLRDRLEKMTNSNLTTKSNQVGFHYFQDTIHYSNQDLETWLPHLTNLSASWIVLLADANRAIPEQFITSLVNAGINPIIHFKFALPDAPNASDLRLIMNSYQRWGVRYVVFFDKPNDVSSWSSAGWSHQDLVERFMDRFIPLAQEAIRIGLTPVFPPLMPGGSYWDTSFFKSSLQSLQRRGQDQILEKMAAGSYAFSFGRELNWGEGGPEQWKNAKPYFTPADSQDQRGFNNFAWLKSIAASLGIQNLPIIQFAAGIKEPGAFYSTESHIQIVESILSRTANQESILACNFWLLAADSDEEDYPQAWVKSESEMIPAVRVLARKAKNQKTVMPPVVELEAEAPDPFEDKYRESDLGFGIPKTVNQSSEKTHQIEHYLLLPVFEWGIADWHLDVIRPFIRKFKPTIGFSIGEAAMAKKVTIIAGENDFSSEEINQLIVNGCMVDQITGDGTSIATQLLER